MAALALVGGVLTLAAATARGDDPVVRYPRSGEGTERYVFARQDTVVATMPTGEEQTQVIGRSAYLSIAWVASDSGTSLTATLDSIVPGEGMTPYSPSLDSAYGARWAAWRELDGQVIRLEGGPSSSLADQVMDQLRLLFPTLPSDGAGAGLTWSDSTEGPALVSAFEARERVSALSAAQAGPDGSLTIAVVRQRVAAGEGLQYLQPISIRATGTDSLVYTMTTDGVVHDVKGRRLVHLDLDLPAVGQRVSAQVRSFLGMRRLP